ncbi:MAG: regulatory protein RecX [Polymorphobacter sp.]
MAQPMPRAYTPPPLDAASLRALGLRYVARYATSAAKLRQYLMRKLKERGWDDAAPPDVAAVVGRMVELGYIDDRVFGEAKVRGLAARGYGARRVAQALGAAGLERGLVAELAAVPDADAAALTYARRRRFGRWDTAPADPLRTQRQFAAMLRAGHAPAAIRRALGADPGDTAGDDFD